MKEISITFEARILVDPDGFVPKQLCDDILICVRQHTRNDSANDIMTAVVKIDDGSRVITDEYLDGLSRVTSVPRSENKNTSVPVSNDVAKTVYEQPILATMLVPDNPFITMPDQRFKFIDELPNGENPSNTHFVIPTATIIDALSRVKEIGVWMDQSRVIMEQIPQIRNELKDITENLLKVFQNGDNHKPIEPQQ